MITIAMNLQATLTDLDSTIYHMVTSLSLLKRQAPYLGRREATRPVWTDLNVLGGLLYYVI